MDSGCSILALKQHIGRRSHFSTSQKIFYHRKPACFIALVLYLSALQPRAHAHAPRNLIALLLAHLDLALRSSSLHSLLLTIPPSTSFILIFGFWKLGLVLSLGLALRSGLILQMLHLLHWSLLYSMLWRPRGIPCLVRIERR